MGFKPKQTQDVFVNKDYEQLLIDADTILIKAAITQQENFVTVTHKPSGRELEFKTKTEFYFKYKDESKKPKGWLADRNEERVEKGKKPFAFEDFEIEQGVRIIGSAEGGLKKFNTELGDLLRKTGMRHSYKVGLGGKGNFRDDYAQITKYKGDRPEKPLLYKEVREEVEYQYRNKLLVHDGIETDDVLGIYGWENFLHHRKTGEWRYLLSYVDKDLKMIISPWFNYGKPELGIMEITPQEAAWNFASQLMTGDSTDCIVGLPDLTADFRKKYGLRQAKGVGAATVDKVFEGKDTKGIFEAVVEAYKDYYGVEPFEFESWRGDKSTRTWLDMLQENARLLWMMREWDEQYNICKTLDNIGVDYE